MLTFEIPGDPVAWKDDSQVCVLRECRKGYSDTPRVLVTVEVVK